ncbi:MAG: hypothetical protein ACE5IO_03905 [Thermoplasmata archaeon]
MSIGRTPRTAPLGILQRVVPCWWFALILTTPISPFVDERGRKSFLDNITAFQNVFSVEVYRVKKRNATMR